MKKFKIIISILLLLPIITSCHTALEVALVEPIATKSYEKASMEFIGFKNSNRNRMIFKNFGAELERRNIAVNRQDFYMGMYSLQDLETYKSSMRYVSFIDIAQLYDGWDDSVHDSNGLTIGGWIVAGVTCFTLFPVYVPMLCAANKNYCKLELLCNCTLYVYDTEKKELVLSLPIEFHDTQVLKGQYSHKKTDRLAVKKRSQTLLYNDLLKYFEKASDFIQSQNN